jgi:hypothetical protein
MELVWGTKDFVIAGQPYQGFPILLWDSMESCSQANQFFRYYLLRGEIGSKQSWPSTGRALYDFFSFLQAHDLDWRDVDRGEAKSLVAAYRDYCLVTCGLRATPESPIPSVGTFNWGLSAPSYATALAERQRGDLKPGFIACDVLLTEQVSVEGIKPFLHKVKTLQALKNIGRVMFIMVGQRFEHEAFGALRSAGVIPATPESLFGKDVAGAFRDLIGVLSDAIQGAVDSSKLDGIINKLGKLEGALGNMRGSFFELLVAELVRKTFAGEVQLNKICTGEDGSAEVDVWAVKDGISARIIECKGMAPGAFVSDEEIGKWLTTRIKRVRYHLKNHLHLDKPKPQFELWTSGILSPEALHRIEKTRSANSTKFDLIVVDSEGIRQAAKLANDESLLKTLEHHFIPAS